VSYEVHAYIDDEFPASEDTAEYVASSQPFEVTVDGDHTISLSYPDDFMSTQ
jgi:hypothetical protein